MKLIKYLMALILISSCTIIYGATLSEQARNLFSDKMMNDPSVLMAKDQRYLDFKNAWCSCTDRKIIDEINPIYWQAITLFKVVISTNVVDTGTSQEMIQDRDQWFLHNAMSRNAMSSVRTDDLLLYAQYLGTLQEGVYVRNSDTNNTETASTERRRMLRIRGANINLNLFRQSIVCLCARAIMRLKQTMPRNEFGDFIRKFVKLGRLNDQEVMSLLTYDIMIQCHRPDGNTEAFYRTDYDNPLKWGEDKPSGEL